MNLFQTSPIRQQLLDHADQLEQDQPAEAAELRNLVSLIPGGLEGIAMAASLLKALAPDEVAPVGKPLSLAARKQVVRLQRLVEEAETAKLNTLADARRTELRLEAVEVKAAQDVSRCIAALNVLKGRLQSTSPMAPVVAPSHHTPVASSLALLSDTPTPEPGVDMSVTVADAVEWFISQLPEDKKSSYPLTLGKFLVPMLGGRPMGSIRQRDIADLLRKVQTLPTGWSYLVEKGQPLSELFGQPGEERISPATYSRKYKTNIKHFFDTIKCDKSEWCQHTFDFGIKYTGSREAGAKKQRPMKLAELKQLFEGQEAQRFAQDVRFAPNYWLQLVGLFTGARINEVCQLNPLVDIHEEDGVWIFHVTEDSEAAEDIKKSVKNTPSQRKVPIHRELIRLVFLQYVKWLQRHNIKQLFPRWAAKNGRAGEAAGDWFCDHIRNLGLRDETPGKCLLGFHAFRHTLIRFARESDIQKGRLVQIVGHAEEDDHDGYGDGVSLPVLEEELAKLRYEGLELVEQTHDYSKAPDFTATDKPRRKPGRVSSISAEQIMEAQRLRDVGLPAKEIGLRLGLSLSVIRDNTVTPENKRRRRGKMRA
ncbi:site-specific integrase [Jeongeupia wiesaeckerbachi]|uniref:site-specific integrase n=1 Tax=Jeongeupia wiesaeckerbachi TaxID=3051218 RepID=UPI003D80A1C3